MQIIFNHGNFICLHCGSLNSISNDNSLCLVCGENDDWKLRAVFESLGAECVEYGFLYRHMYENDLASGGCNKRYALPGFDQILIFAGVSAASGIIGGIAYDVVKELIKEIANSAPRDAIKEKSPFNAQFLQNEDNIDMFINHIQAYLNGMKEVHPSVKGAIIEELIVHEMQRVMAKSNIEPLELLDNPKMVKKVHKKAFQNVLKHQSLRPDKKHWKQLWKRYKIKAKSTDSTNSISNT